MDISDAEKIKNPILAFIAGIIFSAGITWSAISSIHAEQFKTYEASKSELLKKKFDLENNNLEQTRKIKLLEKDLEKIQKKLDLSEEKESKIKSNNLQKIIKQLDSEIAQKNRVLAMQSGLTQQSPKSDAYMQTEKEIEALLEQKNLAKKQIIELITK